MARNYRRTGATGGSRWMPLRYAGTCKVCGAGIAKGATAFYDAGAKAVTCHALACCEADGLTTSEWHGSPISGGFVTVRSERRIGTPAPVPPRVIVTRFNSGAVAYVNSRGRCEDAPCCGCCS